MIRPSSLPALQACPCFESSEDVGVSDKTDGTMRHNAMAAALRDEVNWGTDLDEEQREKVEWAVEFVRMRSSETMLIEQRVSVVTDDFEIAFSGTPDVRSGNNLFDLKWRQRNYWPQMAAYALAMIQEQGFKTVSAFVLFAERKHVEVMEFTEIYCHELIDGIIAKSSSSERKPVACDYCGWCDRRLTCEALTFKVDQIANARSDINVIVLDTFNDWLLDGAHASKLEDADLAGHVLTIARQISNWCDAVEYNCKQLAIKRGTVPTGYKLQARQGKREITSVTDAFAKVGMPQEVFLKLCELKLSPLVEKFSEINSVSKKQAERTIEERLGDIIQRNPGTVSLVKQN